MRAVRSLVDSGMMEDIRGGYLLVASTREEKTDGR